MAKVVGMDWGSNQVDIAGREHQPYVLYGKNDLTVDVQKLGIQPSKNAADAAAKEQFDKAAARLLPDG